jgi:hypothetical protein
MSTRGLRFGLYPTLPSLTWSTRLIGAISVLLLVGCQGSTPAPPPPRVSLPAGNAPVAKQPQSAVERAIEYSAEHPWGADTGTVRLSGTMRWANASEPPAPLARRLLVLRGLPDTPTAGLYYRIRADDEGRYLFDRVKSGEFMLSDYLGGAPHWQLRVELHDGEAMVLDLTPENGIRVRDDFPATAGAGGPKANADNTDAKPDRESATASRLDEPAAAAVTER